MLAFKFTYHDIKEGREFKAFIVRDTTYLSQVDKYVLPINEPDPTINELRFKTGITDIYAIIDMRSWNNYWNNITSRRQAFADLNAKLANDPAVLKSIADYRKEQKQFRIWKAARKWEV